MHKGENLNKSVSGERAYHLKDGILYDVQYTGAYATPLSVDDVLSYGGRYQLVLDDSYFFYVYIGKLTINRKKIRSVIHNYLQTLFPMDLFSDFALLERNSEYYALLYKEDLVKLIDESKSLFEGARVVSTIFCELVYRYGNFSFTDGHTTYDKTEGGLEIVSGDTVNALKAEDLLQEFTPLRSKMQLKGVSSTSDPISRYLQLGIVVAACFVIFVVTGIFDAKSYKKMLAFKEESLNALYEKAGVASASDPYGMMLSKASKKVYAPYRVFDEFDKLSEAVDNSITIDAINTTDRVIRVEGYANDFANMESFKVRLEKSLAKSVTIESSTQVENKVRFVVRYTP